MKKILNEAPIDYGDYVERIDPKLEVKAANPNSPWAKALRGGAGDVERLVGDRFKKLVDTVKRITGLTDLSQTSIMSSLVMDMAQSLQLAMRIEASHKPELEQLAKEVGLSVADAEEDWYAFDLSVGGQPGFEGVRMGGEDKGGNDAIPASELSGISSPEEFEEVMSRHDRFKLEKAKRTIINAIIQGSARHADYAFMRPEFREKLDAIDPRLITAYQKIMAINDLMYFKMEDVVEMGANTGGGGVASKVSVVRNIDSDNDPDTDSNSDRPDLKIVAVSLTFPLLCHEVIKGIEEAKGKYGLPEDRELSQKVQRSTDTLGNESMSLRIGPELVDKIRFALPDEAFENKGMISFFQTELYSVPAKEFLDIISDLVSANKSDNNRAASEIKKLYDIAKRKMDEYNED